jgi:hypothetical protein
MASQTMNLHQRFKTIIQISGDSLYIEGFKDPYFEEEKLLLLFKTSLPYFKTMNVQSKNYVAENIYELSKKIKSFSDIMIQNGISENDSFNTPRPMKQSFPRREPLNILLLSPAFF